MEDYDNQGFESQGNHYDDREEIYGKAVRAGKRTYFFDVRSTRGGDYYLTITESKRRFDDDGVPHYQKHKIFLYKEDFKKFTDALAETITEIVHLRSEADQQEADSISDSFADVNFEDFGDHQENGQEYDTGYTNSQE